MTRMLTADELAGFAEIIDNMLVLGDLAELPAPMTGGGTGLFERSMTSRGATLGGSEIRAVKRFERKYSMAISI